MAGSLLRHIERIAARGITPTLQTIQAEHGKRFNTSPRVTIEGLWDHWRRLWKTGTKVSQQRFLKAWVSPGVNATLLHGEKTEEPKRCVLPGTLLWEPKEKG